MLQVIMQVVIDQGDKPEKERELIDGINQQMHPE